MTNEQLKQIKRAAKAAFGSMAGVRGLGVNDEAVVVFVHDRAVAARLPHDVSVVLDGGARVEWPVQAIVTGDIVGATSSAPPPPGE